MNRKEVVDSFLNKNYLVSPCFLDSFNENDSFVDEVGDKLKGKEKIVVLNKDLLVLLKNKESSFETNWLEFDKSRTHFEKGKDNKIYETFLRILSHNILDERKAVSVKEIDKKINKDRVVVKNYVEEENKKREVTNFVNYFRVRYEALRKILMGRQELQNTLSINKLLNKKDRETVGLIGFVSDKRITKNGNIIVLLEDKTGTTNIIINKSKESLFKIAKDLVLDEVIGITGFNGEGVVFVNNLYLPEVPMNREIKKIDEEIYVGFISDIHVGSNNFLEKEFLSFIDWLNGKGNNKRHKDLALKIKYLFIVGDLVDGVGIYPDQNKDLLILDVKEQYDKLAYYLKLIREDIKIIICPGNHDALRLSVPQPILNKELAEKIYELKNVTLVTNPAYVNIEAKENFPGFDVLMYHGNSFHYYIENVDSLRFSNARDYPSNISKFLLQRRHLAPSHASTLYVPDEREDPLVIDKIPDIMVSGEMHRTDVGSYNNVIIINTSCWQSKTEYEEKLGNNPDPGKFPILNLKTREVNILKFYEQ